MPPIITDVDLSVVITGRKKSIIFPTMRTINTSEDDRLSITTGQHEVGTLLKLIKTIAMVCIA